MSDSNFVPVGPAPRVLTHSVTGTTPTGNLMTSPVGNGSGGSSPLPVEITNGGGGGTSSNFNQPFPTAGTAAGAKDPSGNMAPLLVDAGGALEVTGSFSATSSARATAANPSYSEGSDDSFSQDLSGHLRTRAIQDGDWAVSINQTIPGTTNAVDATNFPTTIDVNTGNASNSTPRVVLATNQPTLSVSGTVTASNPSVGVTGTLVPTAATYLGINSGGNLVGVSTSNPVPITGTVAATQSGTWNLSTVSSITALGTISTIANPVAVTQSGSWNVGTIASISNIGTVNTIANPVLSAQSGTWDIGTITTITSATVSQPTAANLNATVVGTGTFTVQAAQSGSWDIDTVSSINLLGTISTVSGIVSVSGPTASGSSLTANPLTLGGRAATTNPAAVSDAQIVNAMYDPLGKAVAVDALRSQKFTSISTLTTTTSVTLIPTLGAGIYSDLYGLVFANNSSSITQVTISDGTKNYAFELPSNDTRGMMLPAGSAIPASSPNTAWTASLGTAVTSVIVTALGVRNTA